MQKSTTEDLPATQRIDNLIAGLNDWRGKTISSLRQIILEAEPGISEEWKWGTAVYTKKGMVCSAAAFKDHVKMHFFQGASLADPAGLFNSELDAKAMRAIDFFEDTAVNRLALQELIRKAVAFNLSKGKKS